MSDLQLVFNAKGHTTIVSAVCRVSHPALSAPRAVQGDATSIPKYGSSLIFEPEDTVDIWNTIVAVANRHWQGTQMADGTILNGEGMLLNGMLHTPLRAGQERPKDPAYIGKFFVNAGSGPTAPPQMIAADGQTPVNASVFYSGCYVRAFLGIFWFEKPINKGIGIGLNALQFVADGPRIDGKGDARAAFAKAGPIPAAPGSGYNGQPGGGYAAPPLAPPSWQTPQQPVMAPQQQYAAPAPQQAYAAPPPQQAYAAPPPQQAYAAPPPQQVYPPQAPQQQYEAPPQQQPYQPPVQRPRGPALPPGIG
jgi:hypothetical protein